MYHFIRREKRMSRILTSLIITTLIAISAMPVQAQVQDPILSMPDGQVILNISATQREEVEQDLLVATLSYTATDRDARNVQDEVNKAMSDAVAEAKKVETVKLNTGAYYVHEYTVPRTEERQWRGNQSLTLKSANADDLLKLAGKLQDMNLTMGGLSYMLAPETAANVQDNLMEAALKQLQERADRAAAALGKSSAELRDVNVMADNVPFRSAPRANYTTMEMMSMSKSVAAPVAEAGETTISLTVSARALLKP
jgi:predicted secreted protein